MFDPALPIALLFYGYIAVAASKDALGVEGSSVTVIYNLVILVWAILCRGNLGNFKICLLDALVLALIILIALPHIGANGSYDNLTASARIFLGYFLARSLDSTEIPRFLRYCFVLGLGTLAICLLQMPATLLHWQTEFSRPQISGDTANPVIFGFFISLFAIQTVAIMESRSRTRLQRLWCILLVITSVFILSVFGGKTNLISVCLVGLGSVIMCPWFSIKRRMLWTSMFILTVAMIIAVAPKNIVAFYDLVNVAEVVEATECPLNSIVIDPLNREISQSDIGVDPNNTAAVRVVLLRIGFNLFCENVLFGYGPMLNMNPHSATAQILFEYGVLAFVVFITIGVAVIYKLSRCSVDVNGMIRGDSWIVLLLFIDLLIYNEILGSATNLLQHFMLVGAAVALTVENRLQTQSRQADRYLTTNPPL